MNLSGVVLVTGTGTGVGKTMVTAAMAAAGLLAGQRVAVVKPVQTGVLPGQAGDIAELERLLAPLSAPLLARLSTHEFVRLPEALAPQAAARRARRRLPPLREHADRIVELAAMADLVLVEGAGGVLVRLDGEDASGATIADLAGQLAERLARPSGGCVGVGAGVGTVVVTGAELGTLNVTELTVEALRRRGVPVIGLVIGRWPADPGSAEQDNLRDLPILTATPLLALLPDHPSRPPRLTGLPKDGEGYIGSEPTNPSQGWRPSARREGDRCQFGIKD